MAADSMQLLDDRFELERAVFEGGMGTIWLARDRQTGRVLAVKRLNLQTLHARQRFSREARLLASLSHPGVVQYVAHGESADLQPYLAMEWIDGVDLATRLLQGPLDAAEAMTLGRRLAATLAHAHAHGVVHRDLKPANVLLPGGRVEAAKITDFGIARWRSAGPMSIVTHAGTIVGTPGYMAPEQARGADGVDARADLFSLGCVLYEALSGQQAFVGETLVAVLAKLLVEEPVPLATRRPGLPPQLTALVTRLLAKDPNERPQTAADVELLLARLASETATQAVLAPETLRPAPPASMTPRERRLAAVVVAQPPGASDLAPDQTIQDLPSPDGTVSDAARDAQVLAARLADAAAPHGGRFEALGNGVVLLVFTGGGDARDLAVRAGRAALALAQAARHTDMRVALATGWARLDGLLPVGEVIDRSARLARDASHEPGHVRTDRATAALLGTRFDVAGDGDAAWLRAAHEPREDPRTLLGRTSPYVGRAQELAVLDATFQECASEAIARVVVVRAEPGFGKSRLRREWLGALRRREPGVAVLVGHADELRARAPLAPLSEALRRECGVQEGEPPEESQAKLAARVALHVDTDEAGRLSAFLGELAGVPFDESAHPGLRAARRDANLMADLLREAFVDLVFYETRAHPLVLVLEDLHWADAGTVQLVGATLRALPDVPFLVLALGRPEMSERFPALFEESEPRVIDLGALGRRASEKLVREVLGDKADGATVERLVGLAGGHPFLLEELVRAIAEGRGDQLPESVLASVQARLEELDADERRVLRASSVLGEVFWTGAVARLAGFDDDETVESLLAGLASRELVLPRTTSRYPGEREHTFRHALVREAAYAMLTEEDRALGHGLAAAWLEEKGESSPVALAEHLERSGDATRAAVWWLRAARMALEANDLDGALEHVERGAQRARADDATHGRLSLVRAEVLRSRGDNLAALDAATEATALLPGGSEGWWLAIRERTLTLSRLGRQEQLHALVELMISLYDGDPQHWAAVQTIATAATQLLLGGRFELYDRMMIRLPDDSLITEPRSLATVLRARAMHSLFAGDLATYVAQCELAGAKYREAGDLRNVAAVNQYLAYGYTQLGDYHAAANLLRDALQGAERDGRSELAPSIRQNLGRALEGMGEMEEALALEEESLAVALRQGDTRIADGARIYLAGTLLKLGRLDEAEEMARLATAGEIGGLAAYARAELARVLLARGDVLGARTEAELARDELERAGALEEGESEIRLVLAEARHAAGDRGGAIVAIAEAKSRLMARALKIGDRAWRERFLTRVEIHRRTLELAGEWGHA